MGAGDRSGEFPGRTIAQGTVRALLVVVLTPVFDQGAGFRQHREPVLIEAFVANLAVEALDVGVLHRLAGLDELQRLNPEVRVVLLTGFEEPVADKLFQKGLWGYLQKPFRAPELARKVQDAIRTPCASSAASPSSGSTLMPVR